MRGGSEPPPLLNTCPGGRLCGGIVGGKELPRALVLVAAGGWFGCEGEGCSCLDVTESVIAIGVEEGVAVIVIRAVGGVEMRTVVDMIVVDMLVVGILAVDMVAVVGIVAVVDMNQG